MPPFPSFLPQISSPLSILGTNSLAEWALFAGRDNISGIYFAFLLLLLLILPHIFLTRKSNFSSPLPMGFLGNVRGGGDFCIWLDQQLSVQKKPKRVLSGKVSGGVLIYEGERRRKGGAMTPETDVIQFPLIKGKNTGIFRCTPKKLHSHRFPYNSETT